jgi:hypothetical protein
VENYVEERKLQEAILLLHFPTSKTYFLGSSVSDLHSSYPEILLRIFEIS